MFFKKFSSINIVSVVVFLSIVFIGLITNFAKSNMDKAVISATLSEMNQIGVQLEILLEEILEESENDLSLLAEYIEKNNISFDEIVPELVNYAGTFKVGRYNIDQGETDFENIMTKVNLAHQRAKNTKGEMLCDYDETFKQNLLTEAEITNKMKSALDNKEFKVYLQPKFSTNDNILVGAEALVRWIEPDGKMKFPNDFIPLFERNGFILSWINTYLKMFV